MTNFTEKARIGRTNALSNLRYGLGDVAPGARRWTQVRHNPVTFVSGRARAGSATILA
ncbi:hypothetical protein DEA8626_00347 [Defluviimonas aquaemixtae]|uniref:Uncharacterized protein n=1 Tax=Albidovulum aquaemixtae TaxID=1542388 RepID=A0A2R8B2T6_9RHOB|nr:hypothetical protein [Defluviimonas aquaemixtae]SPH16833.1 hypothetical protein DEA8626_00347 [Defluviimonas aquaemixtae]